MNYGPLKVIGDGKVKYFGHEENPCKAWTTSLLD